jgi:CDGSH iron-sulfur domain-containing protein 3
MKEVVIAQKSSYKVELEPGKYWWCACGKSANQPFCDGTHKGSEISPMKFEITEKKTYSLCGCKHALKAPFCDGTHRSL